MVKVCLLLLVLAVVCVQLGDTTVPARNNHANKKAVAKTAAKPAVKHVAKPSTNNKPVVHSKINQVKKAGATCENKATNCNKFIPHCTNKEYTSTLKANCALTCGHCAAPADKCRDNYRTCGEWNKKNFCTGTATTVQEKRAMCAKTCNLCASSNINTNTNPTCATDKYSRSCIEATCTQPNEKKKTQQCKDFCNIQANANSDACKDDTSNSQPSNTQAKCADKYDSACIAETCADPAEKNTATKCVTHCAGTPANGNIPAVPSPNAKSAACNDQCSTKYDAGCIEDTCSRKGEKLTSKECKEFCNGKNQQSIACKAGCETKYDPECVEDTCIAERAPGPPLVVSTTPDCQRYCGLPAAQGAPPSPNANSAACNINCANKYSPECAERTCSQPKEKNTTPKCKEYCANNLRPGSVACNPQCQDKYDSPCIQASCVAEKAARTAPCTAYCLPAAGAVPGGPGVGTPACT